MADTYPDLVIVKHADAPSFDAFENLTRKVLAFNAVAAAVLALASALTTGAAAAVTVLAIGLANSVMFPTIFTLALEELGDETPNGSALLCMAIVGGAIVPVIYGAAADAVGLGHALVVPAVCYLVIAGYGMFTARSAAAPGTGV